MSPIGLEFLQDPARDGMAFRGFVQNAEVMRRFAPEEILAEIVRQVATRWVEENFAKVAAHIDPQAVANLSIAAAGAAVNRTLQERLPVPAAQPPSDTVNNIALPKRGIFGGRP
jgi:hypothetical protein